MIFIGITLAIGFENWNAERNERLEELALLTDLKNNLNENLVQLADIVEFNNWTIVNFETLLVYITERKPYSEDLSDELGMFDNWASPYLTSSAYETLKSRGLDAISESALRQQIVKLFEVEYSTLLNDYDRSEWINYDVSMIRLELRHIEIRPDGSSVPLDYDALLDDQEFRVGISKTLALRKLGIRRLHSATEATRHLITLITEVTSD